MATAGDSETASWRSDLSKVDVWYASFGSNMWKPRFLCYIQGGQVSSLVSEVLEARVSTGRKGIFFYFLFFSPLTSFSHLSSFSPSTKKERTDERSKPTTVPPPLILRRGSRLLVFSVADRNHHRSKPTTDRNPPARTTAIAIQTVSPPYGLVIAGSRRIKTHHRSNVFSCFVLRLLSSSPPEEGSKSTKDEDCVGPSDVSSVFSQSRRSLLRRFTSSPAEEPTTDDECLVTWGEGGSAFLNPLTNLSDQTHMLEQFNDVLFQENGMKVDSDSPLFDLSALQLVQNNGSIPLAKAGWYGNVVCVGKETDIPILTMTCTLSVLEKFTSGDVPLRPPAKAYANTLVMVLVEGGRLSEEEAWAYIDNAASKPL
ncbi:hypothetical protein F2Q69_00039954 [Brassica cretica]|uniref:Uncharacterized protein n=1 Tax=Brassica cretica TaxID=69181 RepID=A0A8S9N2I9_BRACR|nr:hypothetical protein F2Q69_00039954 [Brassica cretica]